MKQSRINSISRKFEGLITPPKAVRDLQFFGILWDFLGFLWLFVDNLGFFFLKSVRDFSELLTPREN